MIDRADQLQPCVVKGCAWRGRDLYACPMHEADAAWDQQGQLMRGTPSLSKIRHRAR